MPEADIVTRNLKETIVDCLKEHTVEIQQGDGVVVPQYLIKIYNGNSLLRDFLDTYAGQVDAFKAKLAERVILSRMTQEEYGVLIDPQDLRLAFAFNTRFGDLDREGKRIAFKHVEDALFEMVSHDHDLKPGHEKISGCPSLIDRVITSLGDPVIVKLHTRGEKEAMYLLSVTYTTPILTDFQRAYPDLSDIHLRYAREIMGDRQVNSAYGLFISQQSQGLNIQYVFNTRFAQYYGDNHRAVRNNHRVVFKTPEEVILDFTKQKDLSRTDLPPVESDRILEPSFYRGSGEIVYALQGPK